MDSSAFLMGLRLGDSFLPVGTYTASYGVEQYVNEGTIETARQLGDLVGAYLERLVGPTDLVALANAHGATATGDVDRLLAVSERFHAATLPAEFRESSRKAGRQLLELLSATSDIFDADGSAVPVAYAEAVDRAETPCHYPVVLGIVTQQSGIGPTGACLLTAYSFVTELLGAAQRLGCFGHTAIQAELTRLLEVVEAVSETYADAPLSRLSSFAPYAEIMGMSHERAQRRLFMS
jgi:urease accessory protein